MALEGTVVNGVIVLPDGVTLPDGARVRIEVEDPDDLAPPPEPYDRATELAILRASHEDAKAGRGMEARAFLKQLAEEHGLPFAPDEG